MFMLKISTSRKINMHTQKDTEAQHRQITENQ